MISMAYTVGKTNSISWIRFCEERQRVFEHCQSAQWGEDLQQSCFTFEGFAAYIHETQFTELSVNEVKSCCPTYCGADLILTAIPKVMKFHQ